MIKNLPIHMVFSAFCCRHVFLAGVFLIFLLFLPFEATAAKVLIIGDLHYAVVAEVVSEIQLSLRSQVREYSISEIKGRLGTIAEREDAQIVVALGSDAVGEAMRLPPAIAVVYGLVVAPPKTGRGNLTGVYMSPPVNEYVSAMRKYFPSLGRLSVVGSPTLMKTLLGGSAGTVSAHQVASSSDLVITVNQLADAGALLLLPDANLLTSSVMEKVFLFSFRNNIPLLGISEANVKQGSLFSFVFDAKAISRQIAEKVQAVLDGADPEEIPASAPTRYNLYVNSNTAHKMGVEIPEEMLKKAKKIYH